MDGRIKTITTKGFGFIEGADGKEYFFHRTGCTSIFENLKEGESVRFHVKESPKGPRAEDVTRQ
jgi:CspA family cold shock protein